MSNKPYKGFEPKWLLTPAPEGSYRSIFRWGDPEFFKYPKESLYKLMKETFHMTDDDFKDYADDIGFDRVELPDHPSEMAPEHLQALREIVGEDFVTTDDYARLSVAYGCTGYDLLRLRHKQIDSLPDVVVYPDTTEQVEELVRYAAEHKLPLYVYGGGSSVTPVVVVDGSVADYGLAAFAAHICGANDAPACGEAQPLAAHLMQSALAAVRTAGAFAPYHGDDNDGAYNDCQQHEERGEGVVVAGGVGGGLLILQDKTHGTHSFHHTFVPIAFAESRHHIALLYAFAESIGESTLQSVARVEAHHAPVHHEEHEHAVVLAFLAYAPMAEQALGKVERFLIANGGKHDNSRLHTRLLLHTGADGIDRVARRRREYAGGVAHIPAHIGQTHVGNSLHRVCLRIGLRHDCGKNGNKEGYYEDEPFHYNLCKSLPSRGLLSPVWSTADGCRMCQNFTSGAFSAPASASK